MDRSVKATALSESGSLHARALHPNTLPPKAKRFAHQAMATVFEMVIVHDDAEYAEQCAHEAFREADRLEQVLSRFIDNSDISRVNNAAVDEPVHVGADAFDCLEHCARLSSKTNGAFDVTLGSLSEYWASRNPGVQTPSDGKLADLRLGTGMHLIALDGAGHTVARRSDRVSVDLGGYGKGYAVDCMARVLDDWDIVSALLHGGASSVLALGAPPGERGWEVTMRHPSAADRVLERFPIQHLAMSGSGLRKGRHIIDPRTGHPTTGTRAAWAITKTAAAGDALSTAFMIMSPAEIGEFCDNHPDSQAIVIPAEAGSSEKVLRFGPSGPPGGAIRGEPVR